MTINLKEEVLARVGSSPKSALAIAMELTPLIDKEVKFKETDDYDKKVFRLRLYRYDVLQYIQRILATYAKKGVINKIVYKIPTRRRALLQNKYQLLKNKDLRGVGYKWRTKVAFYSRKEEQK